MFAKSITKEELNELPLIAFEGNIIEIDNISDVRKAVKYLAKQSVIGFDTETKPNFSKGKRNNVALLQLSSIDNCFLFKLKKTGIPDYLANIFADENIKKIGVAIKDDISALRKYSNFQVNSFIDLQVYAKFFGIEDMGLKNLTGIVLGYKISKNQQVTNWELMKLSDAQIKYAATDAWVCLKIYTALTQSIKDLQ